MTDFGSGSLKLKIGIQIQDCRLETILVVKNPMSNISSTISQVYIYLCCSNLAHREWTMAFISTSVFFQDQIQDGWLAAILLLKHVPKHFSDMHGPILFKLGTSTVYTHNMKTRQAAGDGRSHEKGNFKLVMLEYHKVTEVCDLQKR